MWRMSRIETLAFIAAVIVAVAVMLLAQSLTGSGVARRSIGASGRSSAGADLSHGLEMCGCSPDCHN